MTRQADKRDSHAQDTQSRACRRWRLRPETPRRDQGDRRCRGISLIGRELDKTQEAAEKYGVGHVSTDLADSLKVPGLDAVILATPTQMHAAQALQCLKAGKHVQIEIPLADSLKDAEAVVAEQQKTGLAAMVGHTRRFNPSHQFVRERILKSEFHIQQMDVQTYFFRRTNMNALGAAPLLDRSSALASRRPYRGSLRLSVPLTNRQSQRAAGTDPSRPLASPWT